MYCNIETNSVQENKLNFNDENCVCFVTSFVDVKELYEDEWPIA